VDFTQQLETQPSNRHSSNCSRRLPRRRKVKHMITRHVFNKSRGHWTRIAFQTCVTERRIGTTQQKNTNNVPLQTREHAWAGISGTPRTAGLEGHSTSRGAEP
jgi:hypothetical protein